MVEHRGSATRSRPYPRPIRASVGGRIELLRSPDEREGRRPQAMQTRHEITELLAELSSGNRSALDELVPLVYDELRILARRHMVKERNDHTLDTTALVHEAYLKLVDVQRVTWQDRAHFFAMASRAMRRILIDHARARTRTKRGGKRQRLSLDDIALVSEKQAEDLIALDEALLRLGELSDRQSRVVEMRFFGGLGIEETAQVLGVSPASVKRDWQVARAWLNHELMPRP